MNKRPHGIAFIVNIEKFREGSDYEPRTGSKCDVDSLKSVFNYLHYQTEILENLTRKDFLRNLKDIRGRSHSQYDSFICVIMSHGNKYGQIIFSDDKPLSKDKIVGEFSSGYCNDLKEKPKIFLFQACRGTSVKTMTREHVEKNPNEIILQDVCHGRSRTQTLDSTITTDSTDIFIANSTIQEYVSYRNTEMGSYFIQSFCSVMDSCKEMEFLHIMVEVRRRVMLISEENKQCTEDLNRLSKQVYF